MSGEESDRERAETDPALADLPPAEQERRLQAKLDAGTITEAEYARLTALRFGKDPAEFSFDEAADFFGLTVEQLREEMAWLSDSSPAHE